MQWCISILISLGHFHLLGHKVEKAYRLVSLRRQMQHITPSNRLCIKISSRLSETLNDLDTAILGCKMESRELLLVGLGIDPVSSLLGSAVDSDLVQEHLDGLLVVVLASQVQQREALLVDEVYNLNILLKADEEVDQVCLFVVLDESSANLGGIGDVI